MLAIGFLFVFTVISKADTLIPNTSVTDKIPPVINIKSPPNGQMLEDEATVQVMFTVTDDVAVDDVFLNGDLILPSGNGQYFGNLDLVPGENLIFVDAFDTSDNESSTFIIVTYLPPYSDDDDASDEDNQEKAVITLPEEIEDLNSELINQFIDIVANKGEDLDSFTSVEIANPPVIPEGDEAMIDVPEIEGLQAEIPEGPQEIPKGFSFATSVNFIDGGENINTTDEDKKEQKSVVLIDSAGHTFIVGFGFLKDITGDNLARNKNHRFQTTGGNPLELVTTFTVPGDAKEGNATVSVLSKNEALATISLKITPSKDVKVKQRIIGKPKIAEPIDAAIKKSGKELMLTIKGKNFVGHIATIDGKLQKLLSKTKFLTNVTFVPSDGIKIKKFKLLKNKIVLTAKLENNINPGTKLFNVITPKGATIGGIVFPDPIKNGILETTASPERLILGSP